VIVDIMFRAYYIDSLLPLKLKESMDENMG